MKITIILKQKDVLKTNSFQIHSLVICVKTTFWVIIKIIIYVLTGV